MLDTLITSKTRIKLLLRFFLNNNSESYLRNLGEEFGESTNAIRLELNKFEKAGLLNTRTQGNKKLFKANTKHPLYTDIHNILLKHIGIDKIVEKVITQLGDVEKVFLKGDLARGIDTDVLDLLLVGSNINEKYLQQLVSKAEKMIKKNVLYAVCSAAEMRQWLKQEMAHGEVLLLWQQ